MKKIIVVMMLLLVGFVIVSRYRIYVRDPLGVLTRGGTREAGAQVYINYANDVLLENDNPPRYLEVVQHEQHGGVPLKITCIHWVACLLDEDKATLVDGSDLRPEVMNNRMVQFRDAKGEADVSLR